MSFYKCPLCERIKLEKIKEYNLISKDFFPSLCKEHFYELQEIRDLSFLNWENYKLGDCYICSLEERIEEEFLKEFKEYDALCLYHLKKVKEKLKNEDWEKLLNKWKDFSQYMENLKESYDYRKEKIPADYFPLILDHLLGRGRRI